ncbi:MAG: hypothetical protein PVJ76_18335 [Gemmatimonadota bacterium]|jgi:hypothetical protein
MTLIVGILGAAALFVLFAFSATRDGTRLEAGESCHGGVGSPESCSLRDDCEGCGAADKNDGWWPNDGSTYGDRR